MQNPEKVQKAIEFVSKLAGKRPSPRVGVVLGSGLGRAFCGSELMGVDYADIPGFPAPDVHSHSGRLILGALDPIGVAAQTHATAATAAAATVQFPVPSPKPVWVLSGRAHLYEGFSPAQVCMGVRTLAGLGVETLVLTNAAGALNPAFTAGSLMCIADHVNLQGASPLTGPNHAAWGERFPDMSRAYDARLRRLAAEAARQLGVRLESGVYAAVPGPSMETPAETRMLRTLGCDAVGMSTVQETIAARHMGVRVLGISCLTNVNDPDDMAPVAHQKVVEVADTASSDLARLLATLLHRLDESAA